MSQFSLIWVAGFFVCFSVWAWGEAPVENKTEVPAPGADLPGWTLAFSDEFDSDRLDYSKWTPKDPWGVVRNDELQAYIVKAFHLSDGILKIRCEDLPAYYNGAKRDYRSGMMTTSGKFSQTFGRFEMRCKVPKGKGLWPAFWLLPEPPAWPPEIDILEILCLKSVGLSMGCSDIARISPYPMDRCSFS